MDKSWHIVIDARSRPSSTGRYIDRLLQHLQAIDRQNSYSVLLRPGDSWQPEADNFSVVNCPFAQFSFNPLDQFSFARFIKQLKPDLVHFGMTPQEPVLYRGKRVTTTHDLTMLRFTRAGKLPGWLHALRMAGYRYLLKTSLNLADSILTPTEYVKQDIIKSYPFTSDKIAVTLEDSEPPITGEAVAPVAVSANFHLPTSTFQYILYVGTAFPHKNLQRLVEAFGLLAQANPDLCLVLAGKKETYYQQLADYISDKNYADRVIMTDYVNDAELKWLYENAQAYVFPSLSEGFGLPGLEAMAHGCPVVSSNATCLPEVYGDAAVYFDPTDVNDMADKINSVLKDPKLRSKLIDEGTRQVSKYSWRRMAEQTHALYTKLLTP